MNILMVCLGNICRSPLAHGILEQLSKEKDLNWIVDSAGTGDWHIGQKPDIRSIAVAKKNGFDISNQCGRQFSAADFNRYDKIFVMDRSNLSDVQALASDESQKQKVSLFLKDDIVPDPYTDDSKFEPVFKLIEARCQEIIKELASQ